MKERVQQRPFLLEQDLRKKAVQELEKKIQRAMDIANVTEQEWNRQQIHSAPTNGIRTYTNHSS
jgi:hypothetical protein